MFGPNHYVPILRWKQAERLALKHLRDQDRKIITPLIELTPTIFKGKRIQGLQSEAPDPARVVEKQAKGLLEACGYLPFFLDLRYVNVEVKCPSIKVHALDYLAELCRNYKLALVPVTGLSRGKGYQASVQRIVEKDGRGICLRLTPSEILDTHSADAIRDFLKASHLELDRVNLVVDYEASDPTEPDPNALLARVPHLNEFRSLSVAIGAFPPDLQGFQPGNKTIPRSDYLAWKTAVLDCGNRLRKPSFADYTIQHGLYKEPPEGCNPSVSIRYTLAEEWLIMRGEAMRGNANSEDEIRPGREQWNAHAQLLCENEKLFYGEDFSWGDAFIRERSLETEKHGTPEIWLRAGINHHMTVVSRQIANFGGS